MSKTYLVALVVALAAAPLALAHEPKGTPKTYCELFLEWDTHDYVPGIGAGAAGGAWDSNLNDCDGSTAIHATPCYGFDDPNDPLSVWAGACDTEYGYADYDGHHDLAIGGAILLAGSGAWECYGEDAHHPASGPIAVDDAVLGSAASFTVYAERSAEPCGDLLLDGSDDSVVCIGSCMVPFPPGTDGAYYVFVQGTMGHVIS